MAKKDDIGAVVTIEEALERTSFGRFNYLAIIFSGLVLNNVVLEAVGISFSLPVLKCDLNFTFQQQGILGAAGFIGIIASSHLWGFLADTTGRKRIMRPTMILGFVITVVSSFSPNLETLATMRFLNGFLLSGSSATVFAYIGELHCQRFRNRAILAAAFISAFSAIFFPIIAWLFINQSWAIELPVLQIVYKPWRLYMLACGVPGFICSLMLFYLPESPKYLLTSGRETEALLVLKKIHRVNTRGNTSSFNVSGLLPDPDAPSKVVSGVFRLMWQQTAPLFMRQHVRKTILASVLQFTIFYSAHGVYMWFPYILNSSMQFTQRFSEPKCLCDIMEIMQSANSSLPNMSDDACVTRLEIATYQHTIMLEIIYVMLLLVVSYFIGKIGRISMLFTILAVCGTCGVLALVVRIPLVAIYLFLVLLCCGLGTTVVNAIVVDIYPTNLRAMAVCISLMLGRIGSVAGSNVLGLLIESKCNLALMTAAGALIVAGFLGFFLPKPEARKQLEESLS